MPRRFAIEATIAVNTSGGTTARRSVTNDDPIVDSVTTSQLSLPSAAGPIVRANQPRSTPKIRPMMTWTENDGHLNRFFVAVGAEDTVLSFVSG